MSGRAVHQLGEEVMVRRLSVQRRLDEAQRELGNGWLRGRVGCGCGHGCRQPSSRAVAGWCSHPPELGCLSQPMPLLLLDGPLAPWEPDGLAPRLKRGAEEAPSTLAGLTTSLPRSSQLATRDWHAVCSATRDVVG